MNKSSGSKAKKQASVVPMTSGEPAANVDEVEEESKQPPK